MHEYIISVATQKNNCTQHAIDGKEKH